MIMTAKDHWKKRRIQMVDFARGAIMVGKSVRVNELSREGEVKKVRCTSDM